MTILTTQTELRAANHNNPELHFKCGQCGCVKPLGGKDTCATGYGYATHDSQIPLCYDCMDKMQVEALKDRSKPFCAYVGDGIISTWTGGKLMTITRSSHCELTRQSYTHDRRGYMSIHAVDVHGGHWAGRGSKGIAIKLRPVKG